MVGAFSGLIHVTTYSNAIDGDVQPVYQVISYNFSAKRTIAPNIKIAYYQ